ncbi:peptidoglycan DD-metalloendopeptidase family protein [Noviherbaspirillum sedimenti]|uniref:LysM peptidoglycan-binding domain-containing protein n=1 Tax=Noviherbaspirillum sedimenti TaxID=2320865 RepID=A0A3A3FW88_9BURK|nr:peptidoglycan DD-metalloendopeptidase family protein [Noviherbaspirillum sedimenti]RJG00468.1 LysM peptidoglycan-binding domain-containing protein [Noviherbaspirillum sedimenti]
MKLKRNEKMRLVLPITLAVLLAACSTPRPPAPIVDRTPRPDSRAATTASAGARQMDSHGNYAVRKGDTLFQISQDFGQNVRDLVSWNNLANANDIQVGQLLRVAPAGAVGAVGAPSAGVPSTGAAAVPAIEVRPLNASPSVSAAPPVSAANVPNKTAPRGDKQAYSETALAELQKPDSATPASAPAPAPAPAAASPSAARPVEKAADKPIVAAVNQEDAGISWIWPTDGRIVGSFDGTKKGIDIGGKSGQPVVAAAGGKVMYAGSGIRGYGNLVIVKHTNNLLSAYAHNKTILVKEGQTVGKGDRIAEMGNTDADAVKLHFEIRQQGKPVDPAKFLPSR